MKVVWQSFEGRYSDSPRILFERWLTRRPGDEHIWLADPDHLGSFPPGTRTVPIYSPGCVDALERCDVLMANTHTDVEWSKRAGAFYLQTWHGTPLKRIHRDVLWAPPGRLDRLSRDVERWNVLLSPNAVSTPRLRQAFEYSGEIWETGYPRNDLLNSPAAPEIGRRVRHDLGIADSQTVVLYTPTWRDDVVFGGADAHTEPGLQVDDLLEQLGPEYVLLLRLHSMAGGVTGPLGDRCLDVSQHPDVSELYLAADLMVTDYSSTMFDYAVTGRPLLFFTYDLARFRDSTRGFYFDLTQQAPGPLLATQPELIDAIRTIGDVRRRYDPAYRDFQARYCSLEDGNAGRRLLERVWSRTGAAERG